MPIFKSAERLALIVILAGAVASLLLCERLELSRCMNSAGILFDLAGIVQLRITGLFSTLVRDYFDKMTMTGAPPPRNGDKPPLVMARDASNWLRRQIFVRPRTGYIFVLAGFLLQWVAVWL